MNEEIDSLAENFTRVLVPKPSGKKVIGCEWVLKKKPSIPGVNNERFKTRFTAKGFSQVEGLEYKEIFSLAMKHVSIRLIFISYCFVET